MTATSDCSLDWRSTVASQSHRKTSICPYQPDAPARRPGTSLARRIGLFLPLAWLIGGCVAMLVSGPLGTQDWRKDGFRWMRGANGLAGPGPFVF